MFGIFVFLLFKKNINFLSQFKHTRQHITTRKPSRSAVVQQRRAFFFIIPHLICNLYEYIHCKVCTEACRRMFTSTLLYLIGSESSYDLGSVSYKLNLKNFIYNYSIYILNLVGKSIGKFFRNRLLSGGS
jgi:hypothetical protein